MTNIKKNQAFTLIETVIAISVTAIFFTLVSSIIISVNRTYREMEKVNQMDYEVLEVYRIINLTINSYNQNGISLSFSSDDEIRKITDSENNLCVEIQKLDNGLIEINHQRANDNLIITNKYQRLNDIIIERKENLVEIKIIDNKNRERKMIINIIGGIE